MSAAYGLEPRAVYGNAPGGRVLLYLPGGAKGLRWNTLSEIGKPDSGTEPIHQGLSHSLSVLPGGFVCPRFQALSGGHTKPPGSEALARRT